MSLDSIKKYPFIGVLIMFFAVANIHGMFSENHGPLAFNTLYTPSFNSPTTIELKRVLNCLNDLYNCVGNVGSNDDEYCRGAASWISRHIGIIFPDEMCNDYHFMTRNIVMMKELLVNRVAQLLYQTPDVINQQAVCSKGKGFYHWLHSDIRYIDQSFKYPFPYLLTDWLDRMHVYGKSMFTRCRYLSLRRAGIDCEKAARADLHNRYNNFPELYKKWQGLRTSILFLNRKDLVNDQNVIDIIQQYLKPNTIQ